MRHLVCLLLLWAPVGWAEISARLKWFSNVSYLPQHDVQRDQSGRSQIDSNLDIRSMYEGGRGAFSLVVHHQASLVAGDAIALGGVAGVALNQITDSDARRLMDLSWRIEDGNRHASFHRFDRLAVKYSKGNWAATIGRDAVSWGSGQVFQPMDLFNPFAPTLVDRDFKVGDDLVHVQRLFESGSDLELLAVIRRNSNEDVRARAGSYAAKWHGFAGNVEYELLAANHYDEPTLGVSVRVPLGGALLRSDIVSTRIKRVSGDRRWVTSGVLNLDYSFDIAQKSVYLFGEYYHNGVGVDELVPGEVLPNPLVVRVQRGEVFNLHRDYLAFGGTIQWHPLLTQNLTTISNLKDRSSLLQTSFSYNPGDRQALQIGVVLQMGRAGDEFGGVGVFVDPLGALRTAGGSDRLFLRWTYYF